MLLCAISLYVIVYNANQDKKNAEHLIRAFFQDFNPKSSIVVRGEEAKLEIVFRKPPMAIRMNASMSLNMSK